MRLSSPLWGTERNLDGDSFLVLGAIIPGGLPLPLQPFAEVVKVDVDIGEVFNQAGVNFSAGVINGVRDQLGEQERRKQQKRNAESGGEHSHELLKVNGARAIIIRR